MVTENTTGTLLTLRIEECEHEGDIMDAMKRIQGVAQLRVALCNPECAEVGFVLVKVTNGADFSKSLQGQGFVRVAAQGDHLMDLLLQEEDEAEEY